MSRVTYVIDGRPHVDCSRCAQAALVKRHGAQLDVHCYAGCPADEALPRLDRETVLAELSMRSQIEQPATAGRALRFTAAADIAPIESTWLWEGRIPLGAVTLLAGRQGLGKSTLAVNLAARLSRGWLEGDLAGEPCSTLIVSYEDNASSTIVPRLMAAGADLGSVQVVSAERDGAGDLVSLPDDVAEIGAGALEHGARLVIVDPLVASLPAGQINAHRDQDVRRALAPLSLLAEEHDLAVLAAIHFNKAPGTDVLARTSGSTGFTAAARSVLAFGLDPDDADGERGGGRVLAHAKSNLSPLAPSLTCRLEGDDIALEDGRTISTSKLTVTGECSASASDLLATRDPEEHSELEEAVAFLRDELSDGPRLAREVEGERVSAGAPFSKRTLERAKRRLGVESHKDGVRGPWRWQLPEGRHGSPATPLPEPRSPRHDAGDVGENGWTPEAADAFIEQAKQTFPGSYELPRTLA